MEFVPPLSDKVALALARQIETDPGDLSARIDLYELLVRDARPEAAELVLRETLARSPSDPAVLGLVGSTLLEAEATAERGRDLLRCALELDPEQDFARSALFASLLEHEAWDEAEDLLSPDLPALRSELARALQRAGQHERARHLGAPAHEPMTRPPLRLLRGGPPADLDDDEPPQPSYTLFALVVALLVAGVGFAVWTTMDYAPLYVVNGTNAPATVVVPRGWGDPREYVVPPGAVVPLDLGGGAHAVRVQQRDATTEHHVDLGGATWIAEREPRQVTVLNVAGAGLLLWERCEYAAVTPEGSSDYEAQLEFGEPVVVFGKVNFPFEAFPRRILAPDSAFAVTRVRVALVSGSAERVLEQLPSALDASRVLDYLEHRLRLSGDVATAQAYLRLAQDCGASQRAEAFLAAQETRAPVAQER